MQDVKASELQLGDTIRLSDNPYSDAIVQQIKDGDIHLERPYMMHSDWSYTGGVIVSIGVERFTVRSDSTYTYWRVKVGGRLS